ncbi:unnamed protein product [Brachionus calyciflorus]|uniref:G-protein coupled receptors family 1 profile domain-containing protein n=1 Tax=Brachionus calyciflorus TaxID=104777 RepID=A0A814KX32_9BILA|nr:unnamed protein product [Brachionus calyciflorus]
MIKILIALNIIPVFCVMNKCGNQKDCFYSFDTIVCFDIKSNPKDCFHGQSFIFFKLKKYTILTKKSLSQLLDNLLSLNQIDTLIFSNIYRFEKNFLFSPKIKPDSKLRMTFVDSSLALYNSKKALPDFCSTNSNNFISIEEISFIQRIKYTKISPTLFENIELNTLKFNQFVNTFYLKNFINFFNEKVNSKIKNLILMENENLALDSNIFHRDLFYFTEAIELNGNIKSIQRNLFENMTNLKSITLTYYYKFNLFYHGIEWIKSINKDLDIEQNRINQSRLVKIQIFTFSDSRNDPKLKLFPDEDFCLYSDFPFNQMTMLNIQNRLKSNESCTLNYITLNNAKLEIFLKDPSASYHNNCLPKEEQISKCNFDKMRKNCDFKKTYKSNYHFQNLSDFLIFGDFIFMFVLNSLLCFIGVIKSLSMIVIFKNNQTKNSKFYFIKKYSTISLVYYVINLTSLINQCPFDIGLFCSKIRNSILAQYFYIIFTSYITFVLQVCLNIVFVGYNYFRYVSIDKSKNRFKITNFNFFFGVCLVLGLFLAIPKLFYYEINYYEFNSDYPKSLEGSNLIDPFSINSLIEYSHILIVSLNFISERILIVHQEYMLMHTFTFVDGLPNHHIQKTFQHTT